MSSNTNNAAATKAKVPIPDLPEPAHAQLDSMLARKFGKEIANYFAGSPLNRVSFLRPDTAFLSQALKHESSRFVLYNNLNPLVKSSERLHYVGYNDIKSVVGDPYTRSEDELVKQYNSSIYQPQLVFLGIDEKKKSEGLVYKERYSGQPYWAVDVTPRARITEAAEQLIKRLEDTGVYFAQGRMQLSLVAEEVPTIYDSRFPPPTAAIYAEGRHLLDWNARNPFCGGCGHKTLSVNGGFKRTCPPKDLADRLADAADAPDRPPCATRVGVSNLCFPRTDPTVIMAVVSSDGQRMLLGRQRRWPPHWYSTLAGFLEPAESVEEAVRREVWEESGIHLGRVVIHSTQPWPYPANLMIGAIGQSIPGGEDIHLGHDAELEDARWFSFDEIRESLKTGTSGLGEEPGPEYTPGALRVPSSTAIANQLMAAVVNGFVSAEPKI
ncbi:NUDIX hydrolase domain-like protein [Phyllosticta citrichinensis]|uniref:NAD(+) diphosphatase n=1 Tax=Phyllosticta citrichinensis TaxID=1130410 RepID=A0ABR1XY62_9PEZI